jgi:two-component system, cell cycle sensor histidine kinase and response regulator CckA
METYFQNAPAGMITTNRQGRFLEANHKASELFGYEGSALLELSLADVILTEADDAPVSLLELILEHGVFSTIDQFARRGDHPWFGKVDARVLEDDLLLFCITDVTAIDTVYPQLAEADDVYREMIENMEIAYARHRIVLDDAGEPIDYVFMEANSAFERFTGLKPENIIGRRVTDVLPGITQDPADWIGTYGKVALTGEVASVKQHSMSQGRWLQVTAFCPKHGEFVTQIQDITEQKELQARLYQSEKMRVIGQLAGGVAHDFNNQLSAIIGYADLLLPELANMPELESHVKMLLGAAERSVDLTSKLLAFGRMGKFRNTRVNMHDLVNEVVLLLSRSIDNRIVLTTSLDATEYEVKGDPSMLQSAILNLALNSSDAMENGGEITISTRTVELDEASAAAIGISPQGGKFLVLAVRDTGTGISEEVKERIFEPFFTTKPQGKGTGLGLAAVYGTVSDHNGVIRVFSEPGNGAEFVLYLPLSPGAPLAVSTVPPQWISHSSGGTILLVDDESIIRDLASDMLTRLGYHVVPAASGEEAVAIYGEHRSEIDLVLLDLSMSGLSGRHTFSLLQQLNPRVRVVLSSGFSLNREAQELLDRGAVGFLQKPYRKSAVADEISRVLSEFPGEIGCG